MKLLNIIMISSLYLGAASFGSKAEKSINVNDGNKTTEDTIVRLLRNQRDSVVEPPEKSNKVAKPVVSI